MVTPQTRGYFFDQEVEMVKIYCLATSVIQDHLSPCPIKYCLAGSYMVTDIYGYYRICQTKSESDQDVGGFVIHANQYSSVDDRYEIL